MPTTAIGRSICVPVSVARQFSREGGLIGKREGVSWGITTTNGSSPWSRKYSEWMTTSKRFSGTAKFPSSSSAVTQNAVLPPLPPHQRKTPFRSSPSPQCSFVRSFSITLSNRHGELHKPKPGEELHVTFIDKDGEKHAFEVCEGDNLLDIAQANDLEMEGACGGSAACSTCHVIVTDQDMYDKLPEPTDDENDMLDLAFGLTETSRLGCQVKMTKDIDGLEVKLPAMTRNLQSSDFSKK